MNQKTQAGKLVLSGHTPQRCIKTIDQKLETFAAGKATPRNVPRGRFAGAVRSDGRFRLGIRGSSPLGGLFWLRGTIEETDGGAEIIYHKSLDFLAAGFWVLWTAVLVAALTFTMQFPDPFSDVRTLMLLVVAAFVPVLLWLSVKRSREDIDVTHAELSSWFPSAEDTL